MSKTVLSHASRVRTLFKSILRLHRGLPHKELQELGNNYAKDEFKRHKNLKQDTQEVTIFMFEWTEYYINLAKQLGVKGKSSLSLGKDLHSEALEKLRDEQIVQLHELYKTAKGLDEEEKKQ